MRTIKFRGKIVKTEEWTYGNLLVANNTYSIFDSESYATHEVTPESVGQFTEIYDSTDEEIYEGDIVKTTLISDEPNTDYPKVRKVKFNPWYGWRFGADYIRYGFPSENPKIEPKERVEVIGNIHDNPNLLKTFPTMSEQNKCRTCDHHKRKVRMGEIVSTCTLRATKRSTIDDEITDPDSVCDHYTPKQRSIILGYKGGLGTISED